LTSLEFTTNQKQNAEENAATKAALCLAVSLAIALTKITENVFLSNAVAGVT